MGVKRKGPGLVGVLREPLQGTGAGRAGNTGRASILKLCLCLVS